VDEFFILNGGYGYFHDRQASIDRSAKAEIVRMCGC
jgi:hypothetical protein